MDRLRFLGDNDKSMGFWHLPLHLRNWLASSVSY